jgi:RNA-directed DNA polymerase
MDTVVRPMDEWKTLPWKRFERQVFKLQTRIYRASQRGDVKIVHRLQKLLMQSWAARCLAVRRVTQDNRGKKTAGVDGVKNLTPARRLTLARNLCLPRKAPPTRRVWIPKPGTPERRPLGIPTIADRAAQALVKLALEPEWEARFEPNSYGFRPGRSCHDAIEAIFNAVATKAKYVLDADIAKCFDRINQSALLQKLQTFPTLRRAVRAWLIAGVTDGPELYPTTEGTPQGGVLSPLLANIALHGLETAIWAAFPYRHHGRENWKPLVIRYADDFVVLHPDRSGVERAQQVATEWLRGMGLELKPSKTRISHTLLEQEGTVGFDFLGFHVRQYPVGKTHTARSTTGRPLGFKTLIKPSKTALQRHRDALTAELQRHRQAPQAALIEHLNLLIRGWTAYYSTVASKASFSKLDEVTYQKLRAWAKRRHPKKPMGWVVRRYWRLDLGRWDFATKDGVRLRKHDHTPIRRHVKVEGTKSPFDGDWAYWTTRLGRHPQVPTRVARLLKAQRGRCARCGLFFKDGEVPEVDHLVPRSQGGRDAYCNWQLLHGHCHDVKTAADSRHQTRPSEVPVSRAKIGRDQKQTRIAAENRRGAG